MKNKFVAKVFQWLCIGLLVTFGLGYAITLDEGVMETVFNNVYIIIILELIVGFCLILLFKKLSDTLAKTLYLIYAALTGVTFAAIFLTYTMESVIWVFCATAIIFGIFGFIGSKLKINLSGFSIFLTISLLAMLVLEIINIFLLNSALDMTICVVVILIFIGYIVIDINRIMRICEMELEDKYAVFCAFQLYLDIINIIIRLLELFGKRRD